MNSGIDSTRACLALLLSTAGLYVAASLARPARAEITSAASSSHAAPSQASAFTLRVLSRETGNALHGVQVFRGAPRPEREIETWLMGYTDIARRSFDFTPLGGWNREHPGVSLDRLAPTLTGNSPLQLIVEPTDALGRNGTLRSTDDHYWVRADDHAWTTTSRELAVDGEIVVLLDAAGSLELEVENAEHFDELRLSVQHAKVADGIDAELFHRAAIGASTRLDGLPVGFLALQLSGRSSDGRWHALSTEAFRLNASETRRIRVSIPTSARVRCAIRARTEDLSTLGVTHLMLLNANHDGPGRGPWPVSRLEVQRVGDDWLHVLPTASCGGDRTRLIALPRGLYVDASRLDREAVNDLELDLRELRPSTATARVTPAYFDAVTERQLNGLGVRYRRLESNATQRIGTDWSTLTSTPLELEHGRYEFMPWSDGHLPLPTEVTIDATTSDIDLQAEPATVLELKLVHATKNLLPTLAFYSGIRLWTDEGHRLLTSRGSVQVQRDGLQISYKLDYDGALRIELPRDDEYQARAEDLIVEVRRGSRTHCPVRMLDR